MATSHFQRDKQPPPRSFYEREGFRLGRPNSKGYVMAQGQPPCHKSKSGRSFSINIHHGGWVCFGCGAKGDMVGYIMRRDACDFKAAAMTLGCWDESPSPETVRNMAEQARERDRGRQAEQARQAEERRRRLAARDEIYTASRIWKESCARLAELKRGAVPTCPDEEELQWELLSLALPNLRDSEKRFCEAAGLDSPE